MAVSPHNTHTNLHEVTYPIISEITAVYVLVALLQSVGGKL